MKFTYLMVDLGTILVPFLFSFHPKLRFDKTFKAYWTANGIAALIFIIWDAAFTAKGIWGFNDDYILGWRIYGLPLEEILFFICIPFACIFTYHCISKLYVIRWRQWVINSLILSISVGLLITGIIFIDRAYPASAFISTGIFLLMLRFVFKVVWLDRIFGVYSLLLIPFFIVNGILTGTGLESPVVWYNNDENLGIRMGTIPFEDIFYGFELIILTLFFYEWFRSGKITGE